MCKNQNNLIKGFAAIGAVLGALIAYSESAEPLKLLGYSAMGGVIGMFAVFAVVLLSGVNCVIQAVGAPMAYVLASIAAVMANLLLRLTCPAWVDKNKQHWVVRFGRHGIVRVDERRFQSAAGQQPIYVASPRLRKNGLAAAAGIPLFTWGVLSTQPGIVAETMQASSAFVEAADMDMDMASFQVINPATGLPMMGGMGGIDLSGNTFGHSSMDDMGMGMGMNMDSGMGMDMHHGFHDDGSAHMG